MALKAPKEPIIYVQMIFGIYFIEDNHGFYLVQPSLVQPVTQLELLPCNSTSAYDFCNIYVTSTSVGTNRVATNICTLYFDGSKTKRVLELVVF